MAMSSEASVKPSAALSSNQLKEMYYFARLAREIEERLVILFRQSKVIGGLYRSLGQEGESVATAYALKRTDAILPLIRNMGALTTMGVRPREIFRQYMAKGTANSRGRDLNIHIVNLPEDGVAEPVIVGPISMLGDSIPVAAGIAMGARMRPSTSSGQARSTGSGQARSTSLGQTPSTSSGQADVLVAMAWIGDGATSTGAFHEGLNFAAVQKLPLIVVVEDNKYAYSTPISKQMAIARIDERAAAYGIPHELVDGNDMLAVYDAAKRMVDRARAGAGASLLGVDTMRMQGHAQHDDARYVPREMLDEWTKKDPLPRFRRALVDRGAAKEKDFDDIDRMARELAATEADLAVEDPMPDPATVARGVYAGDDFAEPRLEFMESPFAELRP